MPDIEFTEFMKFYKYYNKEAFSVLVNDTTLPSDNPLRFKKTYYEMTVIEKIKTTNDKNKQSKFQYVLDRETAKMLVNMNVWQMKKF